MLTRYFGQVQLTVADVLTSFHDDGTIPRFNQAQGGKQSAGTGTDHNHLRTSLHIPVRRTDKFIVLRLLIDIHPYLQVDEYRALAGVDTAFQHPYGRQRPFVLSFLAGDVTA